MFSPDGRYLASAGYNPRVSIWSTEHPSRVARLDERYASKVLACAWSPDGSQCAYASAEGTVGIWDLHKSKHVRTLSCIKGIKGPGGESDLDSSASTFDNLAFSPDGSCVVASGRTSGLHIWDVRTATCRAHYSSLTPAYENILTLAFAPRPPDTLRVAAASTTLEGRVVLVYELDGSGAYTSEWPLPLVVHDMTYMQRVAFSPDGMRLIVVPIEGALQIWDMGERRRVLSLAAHSDVSQHHRASYACISSDGKYVACAFVFGDSSIRIWRVSDGVCVVDEKINDHTDCIELIEFSGNGGLLAWGTRRGTVCIRRFYDVDSGLGTLCPY